MSALLLARLDGRRAARAFRRPGFWAGTALPVLLAIGALWLAGDGLRPDLRTGDGRLLMGLLAGAPVALQSYPILFRPGDHELLRRLGIPASALFRHRAGRLLLLAAAVTLALALPFVRAGAGVAPALTQAGIAASVAWGASLLSTARAAAATVAHGRRRGVLATALGWDRELVENAPLVYAPILPVVAASLAARLLAGPTGAAGAALLGIALAAAAAAPFRRGLPRFAPHAAEMAWVLQADGRGGVLVTGRGLPGLLPHGAQVVLSRDAVVVSRRFRSVSRLVPTVGVVAALALLRVGEDAGARRWIVAACAAALAALSAAVVALGRAERGRTRWIDRAAGLRLRDRAIGRGALVLGRGAVLLVPVSLAWAIVAPSRGGAGWLAWAAGSMLAAGLSIAAAGR